MTPSPHDQVKAALGSLRFGLDRDIVAPILALLTSGDWVVVKKEDLLDARSMVESWGAYAPEYFKTKWDLQGDLAKLDAWIAAIAP